MPVYKTPAGAARHGETFGHRIEPVAWFAAHPWYLGEPTITVEGIETEVRERITTIRDFAEEAF